MGNGKLPNPHAPNERSHSRLQASFKQREEQEGKPGQDNQKRLSHEFSEHPWVSTASVEVEAMQE